MTNQLLCIYHGMCDDGFGAAWSVRHAYSIRAEKLSDYSGIDYFPGVYSGKVPDVKGRHVLMVDFCYPVPIMEKMLAECASMTLLDHHKSSMLGMLEWAKTQKNVVVASRADGRLFSISTPKGVLLFDMDRSGAMMAWDHFHGGEAAPKLINYIQDHDLWTKKLERIDEFTAALRSYPMEFEVWDEFNHWAAFEQLLCDGVHILRYKRQLVDIAVKNSFWVEINVPFEEGEVSNGVIAIKHPIYTTIRIRGANVPPAISSEVGEALALRYGGQSLTWCEGYKWIYSLRSRAVGDQPAPDVSLIAVAMGGGGHAQAAGFKTMGPVHKKWHSQVEEKEG